MSTEPETEASGTVVGHRLLTVCEVAERLRIGVQTVRDLDSRGELPIRLIRIGRNVRARSADLDRYLEGVAS